MVIKDCVLFNPASGNPSQTINCLKTGCFKAFRKKFRTKYNIPKINPLTPGFLFEADKFNLPLNIFYSDKACFYITTPMKHPLIHGLKNYCYLKEVNTYLLLK
jgi:hypothetical protein